MNRPIVVVIVLTFVLSTTSTPFGLANTFSEQSLLGTANIIGIKIDPQHLSKPQFIINFENEPLNSNLRTAQFNKLAHYFQDAVSVPENKTWVDPYQKSINLSEKFGKTELGRDLLNQSYSFKELAYSLHYYHKIWFVPGNVIIFQKGNMFYIKQAPLIIMTEPSSKDLRSNRVLSKIEKTVNESKNFYRLRQLWNTIILATLYKRQLALK